MEKRHEARKQGRPVEMLSVVVPAYDEVDNLEWMIAELREALEALLEKWEVVIVDDGSRDGTGALADDLARKYPNVRALHHDTNCGHGQALITGFRACKGDWLTSMPADGQLDPNDFPTFLEHLEHADFITSHYLDRDDGADRALLSKGFRVLLRLLFGPLPKNEGGRFFKREVLESVELVSATFMANLELMIRAHRKGFQFYEVSVHCRKRQAGETKAATPKTIAKVLWELLKLRFLHLNPLLS